jgi:hypothetical protein
VVRDLDWSNRLVLETWILRADLNRSVGPRMLESALAGVDQEMGTGLTGGINWKYLNGTAN